MKIQFQKFLLSFKLALNVVASSQLMEIKKILDVKEITYDTGLKRIALL